MNEFIASVLKEAHEVSNKRSDDFEHDSGKLNEWMFHKAHYMAEVTIPALVENIIALESRLNTQQSLRNLDFSKVLKFELEEKMSENQLATECQSLREEVVRLKSISPTFVKVELSSEQLSREQAYHDIMKQMKRGYQATYDSLEDKIRELQHYIFNLENEIAEFRRQADVIVAARKAGE